MKIKIVPGINNSGPDHWQSLWEKKYGFTRINQAEWDYPKYSEWESSLIQELEKDGDKDVILIAHSLGCLLVVKALPEIKKYVKGIFLVAVPDPNNSIFHNILDSFKEIPKDNFNMPGMLIYSENDEYSSPTFSRSQGEKWGLELINVGKQGHINSQSGLGNWDEGYSLFQRLLNKI